MALDTGLGDSIRTLGAILQQKQQQEEASINRGFQMDLTKMQNEKEAYARKADQMQRMSEMSYQKLSAIQSRLIPLGVQSDKGEVSDAPSKVLSDIGSSLYEQVEVSSNLAKAYENQYNKLEKDEASYYAGFNEGQSISLSDASMFEIGSNLSLDSNENTISYKYDSKDGTPTKSINPKGNLSDYNEKSYKLGLTRGAADVTKRLDDKLKAQQSDLNAVNIMNATAQQQILFSNNNIQMAKEAEAYKAKHTQDYITKAAQINANNPLSSSNEYMVYMKALDSGDTETIAKAEKAWTKAKKKASGEMANYARANSYEVFNKELADLTEPEQKLSVKINTDLVEYYTYLENSMTTSGVDTLSPFKDVLPIIEEAASKGVSINKIADDMIKNPNTYLNGVKIKALISSPSLGKDQVSRLYNVLKMRNVLEIRDNVFINNGATVESNRYNTTKLMKIIQNSNESIASIEKDNIVKASEGMKPIEEPAPLNKKTTEDANNVGIEEEPVVEPKKSIEENEYSNYSLIELKRLSLTDKESAMLVYDKRKEKLSKEATKLRVKLSSWKNDPNNPGYDKDMMAAKNRLTEIESEYRKQDKESEKLKAAIKLLENIFGDK